MLQKEVHEPILKLAERYHVEGWCLLGFVGPWASECFVARQRHDMKPFVLMRLGERIKFE